VANKIVTVVVGGPQLSFTPNAVTAAVGDVVQFQFSTGNHTVTQSTETFPCQPIQVSGAVSSGHLPFVATSGQVSTFSMPVTSTAPMFIYCATGPHCQLGMVMIVNP
jgi:plastocyanin